MDKKQSTNKLKIPEQYIRKMKTILNLFYFWTVYGGSEPEVEGKEGPPEPKEARRGVVAGPHTPVEYRNLSSLRKQEESAKNKRWEKTI